MPARYLLIEFDDAAQADALRAQIDTATRKGKAFRVVGLFARPGKLCQCYRSTKDYKEWGIQRGGKLGWFVCPTCKRPTVQNQGLRNLLARADIIAPFKARGRAFHTESAPSNSNPRDYSFYPDELQVNIYPARD